MGKAGETLCTTDEVVGARLDTTWADQPPSYRVCSKDDRRHDQPWQPIDVHRKSKPSDLGIIGAFKFAYSTENVVYLRFPEALETGRTYELSFPGSGLAAVSFTVDPTRLRSEAMHISQIGFRPDDPAKIAFLSCWMDNGGGVKYETGLPFSVIDDAIRAIVFRGRTVLSKPASEKNEDAYGKNYNGTDVHAMEFSAFTKPGRYRVNIETIGCSYEGSVRIVMLSTT